NVCQERRKNTRLRNLKALLEDRRSVYRPADQPLRGIEKIVDLSLGELVCRDRQIGEVKRLNGFYLQSYFVHDAEEAITRPHQVQQVRAIGLRRLGKIACGRDPLHLRDIGTNLAELYPVERIFAVATGGRPERHVADLDVEHHL